MEKYDIAYEVDHYEVQICKSNGLNYNYICHSEEEAKAYIEEYGIQVIKIKKILNAIW